MKKTSHNFKKAFTLIEALVAISIIGIALVAATGAIQQTLQNSEYVKNQITAYYLAEDAIEYVIAERDLGASPSAQYPLGNWDSRFIQCVKTPEVTSIQCGVDSYGGASDTGAAQNGFIPCIASSDTANFNGDGLGVSATQSGLPSPEECSTNDEYTSQAAQLYLCTVPPANGGLQTSYYVPKDSSAYASAVAVNPNYCVLTPFSRLVTFDPIQTYSGSATGVNAYSEIVVTTTVMWGQAANQSFSLSEDLYNWQ